MAAASRARGSQLTSLRPGLPARQGTRQGKGGCKVQQPVKVPQHPADHPSLVQKQVLLRVQLLPIFSSTLQPKENIKCMKLKLLFKFCEPYIWFRIWSQKSIVMNISEAQGLSIATGTGVFTLQCRCTTPA